MQDNSPAADGQHSAAPTPYDPNTPKPPYACAVCGHVLDAYHETAYGYLTSVSYHHTAATPDDHTPVPTPLSSIRTNFLCDFCLQPNARWRLPVRDHPIPGAPDHFDVDGWAACDDCAPLLAKNTPQAWEEIITRARHAQFIRGNHAPRRAFRALYADLRPFITGPPALLNPLNPLNPI